MFRIESLDADGYPLEVVTEEPAFFALYFKDEFMGYYTTVEACKLAAEDLMAYPESLN